MVSWRVWSLGLLAVVSLACAQAADGNGGGDTGGAGDDGSAGDSAGGDGGDGGGGGSDAGTGGVSGKGGSGAGGAGKGGAAAGAGGAGAAGSSAGSGGAVAGSAPQGGTGGSSPGMLDGTLSKPPPSATLCKMEGETGGDCAPGLVCRIYSEHDGRCEGCSPCNKAGKACTASVQCAIDSQCYGGFCRELCSLVQKGCKQGGVCKDIGNESAGVCIP